MQSDLTENYKGKTILITGGMGYVGSALTQAFSRIDCNLKVLSRSSESDWEPESGNSNISLLYGDVSHRRLWETILNDVDYVFHLAAVEDVKDLKHEIEVNAISMLYLLDVCYTERKFPKIVYSSSANIFGDVSANPVDETFRDNPVSTWSVHKLLAEQYLRVYNKKCNINSIVLRLANAYGPVPNENVVTRMILNKIIYNALNGKTLMLYNNQHCLRDYVFIDDVVRAFLLAGCIRDNLCKGQSYVIGSQEGKSISDVWKLIAKKVSDKTGKEIKIEENELIHLEPMAMRNFISNTAQFRKATGWYSTMPLEKGIECTVNSLFGTLSA